MFQEPFAFPQGLSQKLLNDLIIPYCEPSALYAYLLFTFFLWALKEAFEVFCNKGLAGSSSVEFLATCCDKILKKGGSEKLSNEAMEETIENVFCHFLPYYGLFH